MTRDRHRLSLADPSFDAVLSCGQLDHVEDPNASLEEIRRVLAPRHVLRLQTGKPELRP